LSGYKQHLTALSRHHISGTGILLQISYHWISSNLRPIQICIYETKVVYFDFSTLTICSLPTHHKQQKTRRRSRQLSLQLTRSPTLAPFDNSLESISTDTRIARSALAKDSSSIQCINDSIWRRLRMLQLHSMIRLGWIL